MEIQPNRQRKGNKAGAYVRCGLAGLLFLLLLPLNYLLVGLAVKYIPKDPNHNFGDQMTQFLTCAFGAGICGVLNFLSGWWCVRAIKELGK